jgi:PAS domain S-box-containing protein
MPTSQPLFAQLLAQRALPVVELDARTGTIVRVSPAFTSLGGHTEAELGGRPFIELIPDKERDAVRQHLRGNPGGTTPHTHRLIARDGTFRTVRTSVGVLGTTPGADHAQLLLIESDPASPPPAPAPPSAAIAAPDHGNFFHQFVLNTHEGIWTVDAHLRTTFVNPRICEMLGYTAEELRSRPIAEFAVPDDRASLSAEIARRRQGLSSRYECRFRHKDGAELWMLIFGTPLLDHDRRFCGSFGMFTDITERKRADRALQLSEERYRSLLAAATDYVFTVHYDGGQPVSTTHGPGCAKITGYQPHEYAADPFLWYRMIAPADRAAVERHIGQVTGSDRAATIEHRLHHRDGSIRWVRNTLVPRRDPAGRLLALDGLVTDITAHTLAAQALRDREHQLRLIIDTVPALIAYLDPAYRYHLLNRTYELWFGESLETIMAHRMSEQVGPDAWSEIQPYVDRALAGETVSFELEVPLRVAGRRWLSACYTPDIGPAGQVRGIVILVNDITARKELEARLLRAQRLEVVGRLAGGIAHNLNNTLQPVFMASRLLRPAIQDPEAGRLVDTIAVSVRRAAEVIQQLLAFSHSAAPQLSPLQLETVVAEGLQLLGGTLPPRIALRAELPCQPRRIMGDATHLHQVLLNLCANAVTAMQTAGGTLTVRVESVELAPPLPQTVPAGTPGRYVVLAVADTGTGIAPEHLPMLFDPFFTTKDVGEGSGLGLPVVLGIVRSHNGFVQVSSTPGQGSLFRVFLPAIDAPASARPPPEPPTTEHRA